MKNVLKVAGLVLIMFICVSIYEKPSLAKEEPYTVKLETTNIDTLHLHRESNNSREFVSDEKIKLSVKIDDINALSTGDPYLDLNRIDLSIKDEKGISLGGVYIEVSKLKTGVNSYSAELHCYYGLPISPGKYTVYVEGNSFVSYQAVEIGTISISNVSISDANGEIVFSDGGKTLTIKGSTNIYTNDELCERIERIVFTEGIDNSFINKDSFSCFKNLKSISLPEGLETIGEYAFEGCTGLERITLPKSIKTFGKCAFLGCTGIKEVTLPEGLETIGDGAFSGCTGIESITIPKSIKTFGGGAFHECTGLKEVTLPEGLETIGKYAFEGCTGLERITLPKSIKTWEDYAFSGCTGLHEVTLSEGLETIGDYAFEGCTGIESITIPKSIKSFGDGAFWGCTGLKSINLQKGLVNLGDYAFSGCTGLESVIIPDGVKIIDYTFESCTNLKKITIPISVDKLFGFIYRKYVGPREDDYNEGPLNITEIHYGGSKSMLEELFEKNEVKLDLKKIKLKCDIKSPKATKLTYAKSKKRGKATLKWKKVSGVKGYIISYGKKTIKVKGSSKTSKTIKGLAGKNYKFKIRTYKTVKGYTIKSDWSKTKKIRVI